jgi:hypothetical protein
MLFAIEAGIERLGVIAAFFSCLQEKSWPVSFVARPQPLKWLLVAIWQFNQETWENFALYIERGEREEGGYI